MAVGLGELICDFTMKTNSMKGMKLPRLLLKEEKNSQGKAPHITGWIITQNKTLEVSRESKDEKGKKTPNWLTETSCVSSGTKCWRIQWEFEKDKLN